MKLAEELELPVVIHDRDAHQDTLEIIKEYPDVTGVVHCFSGSVEFAQECIKLGYYIGFTGVVTFKNAKTLKEVAAYTPLDRIVLETDCPYLSPEPNRGKRNSSLNLNYVAEALSQIKGINKEELIAVTEENARQLYRMKEV